MDVSFGAGPSGAVTVTYNDGSTRTAPFTSGFGLGGDVEGPVCGGFQDCFWSVGHVLTLDQFNAAPDPWALISSGMTSNFSAFFGLPFVELQGFGSLEVHSVPEPAALSLLALGLAGVGLMRRRKKH